MRRPRDLSGDELVRLLKRHGYVDVRQRGSHVRLVRNAGSERQRITIPRHRNLSVGTLNAILSVVAEQIGMERDALMEDLFS